MNVLILTPDAVGSTLLQRLLTIYMQFHIFNKPVINLHELTNGIQQYYSADFNREILGRSNIGYVQSLSEITNLLKSMDHYKVARLAKYHINNRKDSLDQQLPFYEYLNNNFFVIACRRENVFEHAISWGINRITKKLNVYSPTEKIDTFYNLYKSQVTIDETAFIQSLENYKAYLQWCEDHFSVGSYFHYDTDVKNIEDYILNLPVFAGQSETKSWKEVYGISFTEWNRCHYFTSNIEVGYNQPDINLLTSEEQNFDTDVDFVDDYFNREVVKEYNNVADPQWPLINSTADFRNLPSIIKDECFELHNLTSYKNCQSLKKIVSKLPKRQLDFLRQHYSKYAIANDSINKMELLGILPSNIPIKKQPLIAKKAMVKNFDQCLDLYNEWINLNPSVSSIVTQQQLTNQICNENKLWNVESTTIKYLE